MRVALVGAGAFGRLHLEALGRIDDVDVVAVASDSPQRAREVADRYGVERACGDLDSVVAMDDVDAVILCTPTPLHAAQTIAALRAGKHVLVEIPLADSWTDALAVAEAARATDRVCMVGHTRRFNPSHQWIHGRVVAGDYALQHLDVQTVFMRRTNVNALGEPRDWVDNLLWHHAAHTVDLFAYQTGEPVDVARVLAGPTHPELAIPLDLSVQLRSASGALCTLALSFNNDGPLGTFFRYIGDRGTYLARYDDLTTGHGDPVDVSGVAVSLDGVELQDREFVAAIVERRAPLTSVESVLGCYEVLGRLQAQLDDDHASSRLVR